MTIIYILLALVAGYAIGVMRTQREAISAKEQLKAEQQHTEETMRTQAQALRAEFKAITADMMQSQGTAMREQGNALREIHIQSLEALLKPLGHDIEDFRTQFLKGHASLDGYIKALVEQTSSLGKEAEDLAKALKGNTKLQGNWGEAVLANLLSASGLTEGRDFTLQEHLADGNGSVVIPDVIVHLPEHRNLIIDSKVSMKAFTEYVAANDAIEQDRLIKEHVRSVKQHIKELAAKNYNKIVPDSIGYVLMFIPGEAAYVAAVTAEPNLPTEAYAQHVILINPTNLLMALQLAYNLWQSELQSQSVSEIYHSAERLYKKFTNFAQNFVKIGNNINQLQRTFEDAEKQLSTGRGNIVSQLEGWKKKGLTPSSSLPKELCNEDEADDE